MKEIPINMQRPCFDASDLHLLFPRRAPWMPYGSDAYERLVFSTAAASFVWNISSFSASILSASFLQSKGKWELITAGNMQVSYLVWLSVQHLEIKNMFELSFNSIITQQFGNTPQQFGPSCLEL